MVYNNSNPRGKGKPRGRPFKKGNKKGKITNKILDDSGHKKCVEGETLAHHQCSLSVAVPHIEKIKECGVKHEETQTQLKEEMQTLQEEQINKDTKKDLELIDSLEFKNGENKLTIRFSKKHNRMFRIQIFLNDESEIRPVTYTGASTGYSFWNLLKGNMKK